MIYRLLPSGSFSVPNPVSSSARFRIDDPSIAEYVKTTPIVIMGDGGSGTVTKPDFNVTFDANGGERVPTQVVTSGTAITLPSATREGYTFNGWISSGALYQAGASFTVNADVTFTARWTQNGATPTPTPPAPTTYTVTFNANGGAGTMSAQSFTAGTAQNN